MKNAIYLISPLLLSANECVLCSLSPLPFSGTMCAIGTVEGQIIILDTRAPPAMEPAPPILGEGVTVIKFSKDAHKYIAAYNNGMLRLYQADGLLLVSIDTGDHITSLNVSSDLNSVITTSKEGKIKMWNMIRGS